MPTILQTKFRIWNTHAISQPIGNWKQTTTLKRDKQSKKKRESLWDVRGFSLTQETEYKWEKRPWKTHPKVINHSQCHKMFAHIACLHKSNRTTHWEIVSRRRLFQQNQYIMPTIICHYPFTTILSLTIKHCDFDGIHNTPQFSILSHA